MKGTFKRGVWGAKRASLPKTLDGCKRIQEGNSGADREGGTRREGERCSGYPDRRQTRLSRGNSGVNHVCVWEVGQMRSLLGTRRAVMENSSFTNAEVDRQKRRPLAGENPPFFVQC